MTKLKFYKYAAIILLIFNIGIIAFAIFSRPRPNGGNHHLMNQLNMEEDQHELFLASAQKHGDIITSFSDSQKVYLRTYFSQLLDSTSLDDSILLSNIQYYELQKIETTYHHFEEIKKILRPEQEEHFEKFMEHILSNILNENRRNPRPMKHKK